MRIILTGAFRTVARDYALDVSFVPSSRHFSGRARPRLVSGTADPLLPPGLRRHDRFPVAEPRVVTAAVHVVGFLVVQRLTAAVTLSWR